MIALPELLRGGVCYRFPLTPEATTCLTAALLADVQADRLAWVTLALTRDPAFALWSALQAPELGEASIFRSLLEWTAGRLTNLLAGPGFCDASQAHAADSEIHELLVRSRAVASATLRHPGADPETAAVIALLHNAPDCLALCGTPRPDRDAATAILPTWLKASLARLASGDAPPGSAEERVAQSMNVAADGAHPLSDQQPAELNVVNDPPDRWTWPPALLLPSQLLAQLAARVARLEQLEQDFDRSVEHAKLEALKEFAYGAGHEINNPLANISARAQTLLRDERDPERRQKLAAINTQAFRAHEMIADLMLFARPPELKPERLEIAAFLTDLAKGWQTQAADQHTEIELRLPTESLVASADRAGLAVAVRALVVNALEALGQGGRVTITASPVRLDGVSGSAVATLTDALQIVVSDNGPGISPEIRARLFDPYFSGAKPAEGWGLACVNAGESSPATGAGLMSLPNPGAVPASLSPSQPARPSRSTTDRPLTTPIFCRPGLPCNLQLNGNCLLCATVREKMARRVHTPTQAEIALDQPHRGEFAMKRYLIAGVALAATVIGSGSVEAQQYYRVYSVGDAPLIQSSSGVATSYYAPAATYVAPTTTYYAPAAVPYTSYYAPAAVPYTSYYAAPYSTYYAGGTVPYSTYYAPTVGYYYPRVYVPGQPVRNWMRGW